MGATGTQVDYQKENGYLLYFSDRRGMLPNVDLGQTLKDGEYGFEDVVNPADAAGNPNGLLDVGEDLDGTGAQTRQVEKYGGENLGLGLGVAQPQIPNAAFAQPNTSITGGASGCDVARKNWVSGARHAVRLVDGSLGNLPFRPDNNEGGFTLASENPVYILGDYNARANAPFADGDGHVSSAVIADAVTLLSNSWQDAQKPHPCFDGRQGDGGDDTLRSDKGAHHLSFPLIRRRLRPSLSSQARARATRRVDGSAIRRALGIMLQYPSYRVGIPAALKKLQ